ncbi:hypothetical protein ORI20_27645 [Mycobacterium sp. CVI_P3]|uniref:Uncharacterized protein n=1 Tax=Mycobacterium pinniadriaticum TaxID=2994102 RepID=A0ABT3SLR0_9MYCO|nr:hypothetical protein [Mycobacterium pinniadriaticum]MCX2934047.1 hypothetical protein [Mycobacterium pinniadriaticum]MCX2940456.1 hypothetical protein [Mycobacterium pinniadriaticum]
MTVTLSPDSIEMSHVSGRLGALKSRGVPDDDPRVAECRDALAYCRLRNSIAAEGRQLSPASITRLVSQLREVVAS